MKTIETEKYDITLKQDTLFEESSELAEIQAEYEANRINAFTILISLLALLLNLLAW